MASTSPLCVVVSFAFLTGNKMKRKEKEKQSNNAEHSQAKPHQQGTARHGKASELPHHSTLFPIGGRSLSLPAPTISPSRAPFLPHSTLLEAGVPLRHTEAQLWYIL